MIDDERDLDYIRDEEEWHQRTGEKVVGFIERPGFCPSCGYRLFIHLDRCPTEAEARALYGDR